MPQVALLSCAVFTLWLLQKDREFRALPSNALWIPGLWLAILGSRSVTQWLRDIRPLGWRPREPTADQLLEGALVVITVVILVRRRFPWGRFVSSNKALILIYAYWMLSALWAVDGSVPVFKRLYRDFGCVLVGLVLLTESNPWAAIRTVFARLAFVILPLSIVLMKYFPEIGRVANRSGSTMYAGVALHKNTMGLIAFVFTLVVALDLLSMRDEPGVRAIDRGIRYVMIVFGVWALQMVQSKTALLCLTLGFVLFWATGRLAKFDNAARVLVVCTLTVVLFLGADAIFGVSRFVVEGVLNRNMTLTGRTDIWDMVLATNSNSLRGEGYYSFWDSEMSLGISQLFPGGMNTAHNGFIETYLDGGWIGVILLVLLLATWLHRTIVRTVTGTVFGRVSFVFFVLALIYNNSETDFFRNEPLWFTLLLVTSVVPGLTERMSEVGRFASGAGSRARQPVSVLGPSRDRRSRRAGCLE